MKYWLFFAFFAASFNGFSQENYYGNLTIFSEKGERFFLYLNGEKKNDQPLSKIRVENLTQLSYDVKLVYDDASHFTVSKKEVFISDGEDQLMDAVYKLTRKGSNAKLKFYAMNPVKGKQEFSITEGTVATNSEIPMGTLSVFSEQGDAFFLYLNGKKQNEKAVTRIRVEGLSALAYQVKIAYSNEGYGSVTKQNVFISDGDDVMMDASYRLIRHAGTSKLRFYAMNPAKGKYKSEEGVWVVQAIDTNATVATAIPVKPLVSPTDVQKFPANANESPAAKFDPVTEMPASKSSNTKVVASKPVPTKKPIPTNNQVASQKEIVGNEPTLNIKEPENWVCRNEWPMWKTEYATAKKNIYEAKTDLLKLEQAKALANKNCLSSDQVAEIGGLLLQETSKLEFAKFAFNHTIDIRNYQKVSGIFSSAASKKALRAFIGNL